MRARIWILLVLLWGLPGVTPSWAEEEIIGTVTAWNASHVRVATAGGTRQLDITPHTRFFNGGFPVPQRRILPNTLVRVAPKDGAAQTITILQAPR